MTMRVQPNGGIFLFYASRWAVFNHGYVPDIFPTQTKESEKTQKPTRKKKTLIAYGLQDIACSWYYVCARARNFFFFASLCQRIYII